MTDNLIITKWYTLDYLRTNGLINADSLKSKALGLRCVQSAATSEADYKLTVDSSPVFEVYAKKNKKFVKTVEYTANQTGTILVAKPGVGRRIVVTYAAIRTVANSGEAYLHDSTTTFSKIYISVQTSFGTGEVEVRLQPNEDLKITTTQGSQKLFCVVEYYIEAVR